MDFNKYRDLQEHFCNFKAIVDQHDDHQKSTLHLNNIIAILNQEVECLRKSEQKALQQLQNMSISRESQENIHTLYIKLKDKCNDLQNNYNILQMEYLGIEKKFEEEKNKIIEDFKDQIKLLTEKASKCGEDVKNKQAEIAMVQASADIQFDEMESRLQNLLHEEKLHHQECKQSYNSLRNEYLAFKTRSNSNVESTSKYINELERKLTSAEQKQKMYEEFINSSNNSLDSYSKTKNNDIHQQKSSTNQISSNRNLNYLDDPYKPQEYVKQPPKEYLKQPPQEYLKQPPVSNDDDFHNMTFSEFEEEYLNMIEKELPSKTNNHKQYINREPQSSISNENNLLNKDQQNNNEQYSKHVTFKLPNSNVTPSKYDSLSSGPGHIQQKFFNYEECKQPSEPESYAVREFIARMPALTNLPKKAIRGRSTGASIPPLKPCSTTKQTKGIIKKRKLFNPKCLDYLNEFEK